jgi:hypothetical protein
MPSFGEDRIQRQANFYYNSLESSHVLGLLRCRSFSCFGFFLFCRFQLCLAQAEADICRDLFMALNCAADLRLVRRSVIDWLQYLLRIRD